MTTSATASRVLSADGTTIAYERSGSGPAVVLVDGAMCYRESGPTRPLAELLASDFTVFAYDRRGRGDSDDTAPYSIEREIEDLAAIVEEAGGSANAYGVSSGAVLAMHAAASGVPLARLALFEPPIEMDDDRESELTSELRELVAAGRRREAVEHFQTSIGVPPEIVAGMDPQALAALESIAPTLVYDCLICDAGTREMVTSVTAPAIVIDSEASSGNLTGWAATVAEALPNGSHVSLAGRWHVVPDDDLVPVLTEFFRD